MILAHFKALMGPLGLYQHARLREPRLEEGYCTDDNARAVQLLVELQAHPTVLTAPAAPTDLEAALQACWQFLVDAQGTSGLFKNFRDVRGRWLDAQGSEETQARTLRALTSILNYTPMDVNRQGAAADMLERLLPQIPTFVFTRSRAEAIIALAALLPRWPAARGLLASSLEALLASWRRASSPAWPWFEPRLTYANALLPHAMLAGASALDLQEHRHVQAALQASSVFLLQTTIAAGLFAPVGNAGWFPRGGKKAAYDQQPIEAHTMFDFLLEFGAAVHLPPADVAAPYLWFWGHNTMGRPLAERETGACRDGLTDRGVNENCGAESTLAYLRSELLLARAPEAVRHHVHRQLTRPPLHSARAAGPT